MKNLFLLIIIFSVFGLSSNAQDVANIQQIPNGDPDVAIVEHLGESLPLDLQFVDDNFKTVTLKEIIDKPTVFSFVYFDCPGLCSPLLDGVGDVISKTEMTLGKDYQVVTISFNFRDTPEKAKQKKENFTNRYIQDNTDGWKFLTADSATIFKMIDAVGYKIKPVGFDFVHPSAIVVVSPNAMITRYLYGITFLPFDLKMAVSEAQDEKARPTINKVLLYCFSYDTEGQRYTFEVTKIAATVIILFAVILFIVLILKRRKKSLKTKDE